MKLSALIIAALALLQTTGLPAEKSAPIPLQPDKIPALDQTQFVGAEKCATCHQQYFEGWKATTHSKMVQRPTDKTILADFSIESPHHPDIKDVKWVVGTRWKQRFLVEVNGQEVVFPGQWSVKDKKWQPYTAKSDWWWADHQDWKGRSNFQLCAGCHSTGLDLKT